MKKLVFVFATFVALSFAACTGNVTNVFSNDSDSVSAIVDTTVDTCTFDTIVSDSCID